MRTGNAAKAVLYNALPERVHDEARTLTHHITRINIKLREAGYELYSIRGWGYSIRELPRE